MAKPTLKYVDDPLATAFAIALYEEYARQATQYQRGVPGVYASHGCGDLMARMDLHGSWVVMAHQWGVNADVPKRLIQRAVEIYRAEHTRFGHLVGAVEVRLLVRLSYSRSQERVRVRTKNTKHRR